jgi:CBS domain containing-hemolysin-like protein
MTGFEWAVWAALAVLAAIYLVGAAVAAVFAVNTRPDASTAAAPGGADSLPLLPPGAAETAETAEAVAAGRGLALLAGIGAAFTLAVALSRFTSAQAWQYVAGAAAMIALLVAVQVFLGATTVRRSSQLRRLLTSAARLLAGSARVLSIERVLNPGRRPVVTAGSPPEDVTAALAQNLERLERTGLEGDNGELRMIKAVLSMDTARVREIMRPRVDMVTAGADASPEQLTRVINDRGHSKIPIYAETIDEIVGVVYARDLLRLQNGNGDAQTPKTAREIARPAIFVPESQRLEQLLREFQRHRTEIAIVVDEYGGVAGLVTVQDLIEEIVGELVDEFDRHEPDVERVSEAEATMDARVPIDSLNDLFGVAITAEGFDTVGGLVYRELGKMPVVGDTVDVQSLRIAVESTMGRRIRRLRVRRVPEMSDTPV